VEFAAVWREDKSDHLLALGLEDIERPRGLALPEVDGRIAIANRNQVPIS